MAELLVKRVTTYDLEEEWDEYFHEIIEDDYKETAERTYDGFIEYVMDAAQKKDECGWTDFHNYFFLYMGKTYEIFCDCVVDAMHQYMKTKAEEYFDKE